MCERERELVGRDYFSKWQNVSVFWISNFKKKIKRKALILHQVQLGIQKREGCLYFFTYTYFYSQIWLNGLIDDCHFHYITKLKNITL
jgi:hypothetical protein